MPRREQSTSRRRADYEDIDAGHSETSMWYNFRWIVATGLLCFGVFVVFVSVTAFSLQSTSIETIKWPSAQTNGSLGLEFLSQYIEMPQISQMDIEQAYKQASLEISSQQLVEDCSRNVTKDCSYSSHNNLNVTQLDDHHQFGNENEAEADNEEKQNKESTMYAYQYSTNKIDDKYKELFTEALVVDRMAQIIAKRFHFNRTQAMTHLSGSRVRWHNCSAMIVRGNCSELAYRSFDGTCNNLKHPDWGVAGATYRRGLPPDYGDGISSPRRSSGNDGDDELPSAREVSYKIHMAQATSDDLGHSALMTFWGQFVTHDISSTAFPSRNQPCNCQQTTQNDSSCFPIDTSEDPFFSNINVSCLRFIRSQAAAHPNCIIAPREQANLISSYLDGSVIYGSKLEDAIELRNLSNGLMKTSKFHGEYLLPANPSSPGTFCTQASSSNKLCFVAGDSRCNENPTLTSFHTLFVLEHNRLSTELRQLNPDWLDERLFQEARRIVIAELQHITYAEYLPKLLAPDAIVNHGLALENGSSYYHGYSDEVDPTIANEFSTAVFRFGHSMVRRDIEMANSTDTNFVRLHKGLYTPWRFQESNDTLASVFYGASKQNPFKVSPHYTEELGNRLFQGEGDLHGLDLAAITVQRGRDHGIPSYNAFRKMCGEKPLTSPDQLEMLFGKRLAQRFLNLYKKIEDIDLCSGGLAEPHFSSGILGPTYTCIVGDQFSRLRRGDRFWYENGPDDIPNPFTQKQLAQIRRVSLARVICDNVPSIRRLQPDVFLAISPTNAPVSCSGSKKIPKLNIIHWFDERP